MSVDRYKNKYRIPSARLRTWDYGWNAAYFVTICTKNRKCFFGEIVRTAQCDPMMVYTPIGQIAYDCWIAIPEHFPCVKLGVFQVMPNHVHGIVIIDKSYDATQSVSQNFATQNEPMPESKNKFGPQSQNLGSIIRGFKVGVTIDARKIDADFGWQPRFHDHIIRDEISFYRISEYIKNNPFNWDADEHNPRKPGKS
jgi:putative transposase